MSPKARPAIVIGQGDGVAMVRVPLSLFARRTLAYVVRTQFGDRHQQLGLARACRSSCRHAFQGGGWTSPARFSARIGTGSLVWVCSVLEIPLADGILLPSPSASASMFTR